MILARRAMVLSRGPLALPHVVAARSLSSWTDAPEVPIIDFSKFLTGSVDARAMVASDVISAFTTIGFVTLVNHGIDEKIIGDAFEQSRNFFALDRSVKLAYKYQSAESNRGYIALGQEAHPGGIPEAHESFDIGFEADPEFSNHWPDAEAPSFKPTMLRLFDAYDTLHFEVLRSIAIGLNLDADFFTPVSNDHHQNLRLLHYPEIPRASISSKSQTRISAHKDYGSITLLSQEKTSGLFLQTLEGSWMPVLPVPGGILVNIGEMLERRSCDTLRATPHQVLDDYKGDSEIIPARYSIAFFCNFNRDSLLEPLPGLEPKYPVESAHSHITRGLAKTIAGSS